MKMKKTTLYNKSSKGKTKIWSIWVDGADVVKEWGLEGCKFWETRDTVNGKNIGKSNETSPKEQALLEMERAIRLKKEEGYAETLQDTVPNIDWTYGIIPDSFAPSKPEVSIEPEDENALNKLGRAIYQRKHNGQRAFVIKDSQGNVNIYSRRLKLKTALFPKHVAEFKELLKPGTIVDCECIAHDDPDLIKTIFGADAAKAIERQRSINVEFIIFDMLYYDFDDITNLRYILRYNLIQDMLKSKACVFVKLTTNILSRPSPIPKDWEGLVLKDKDAPIKIRWDGKPDRKSGSWKIKNFKECDVVAYKWVTGKGKNNNRPAKLFVGAYDDSGNFVEISEVGSGLCESHKDDILSGKIKLPVSIEIKYEEVTPAKSFRLPIFLRFREDKPIKECLISDIKGFNDNE